MINTRDALLPALKVLEGAGVLHRNQIIDATADLLKISDEERQAKLPSGRAFRYRHRISWAITFLTKAKFVARVRRGYFEITPAGLNALKLNPSAIDGPWLREHSKDFDAWTVECRSPKEPDDSSNENTGNVESSVDDIPPEEALEQAYSTLERELAEEILDTLAGCSPAFFEDLVVKLLVEMGYGGSFEDAARSVGKSGDGGIDGIIKEDRLGLDAIYVQAKRWQNNVGRPDVQAFVGALTGHRAKKGVFITTSDYSSEARDYVKNLEAKVVLINGSTLAEYMIEVGLGVSPVKTYEVKRLDSDFFEE